MQNSIKEKFSRIFKSSGNITVVRAPGRVNLIGEHTDYNGGFVLPAALQYEIVMAGERIKKREVSIYAENMRELVSFSLDKIEYDKNISWVNYPKGVIFMLKERGIELSGMNIFISGDIPIGVGLSSSAAIEVASALLFKEACGFSMNPVGMAKLCQRAENEFVGMRCGLMDQFICCLGKKGNVLFIDCLTEKYEFVPLPEKINIVICNTGVSRKLPESEYNMRRKECEEGVAIFRKVMPEIENLRQVSLSDFERLKTHLSPTVQRRCEHVLSENDRVLGAVRALKKGELSKFGKLMEESHASLRDKYEVSCPELDLMVEIATNFAGCIGSRMTGAGFGGCTVNLVEEEAVPQFREKVQGEYFRRSGIDPEIYASEPSDGAGVVSSP